MESGKKRETFGFGCQKMVYIRREFDKTRVGKSTEPEFRGYPKQLRF